MQPKEVLTKWAEYMTNHNLEKLIELYDEDAVNLQVAVGIPLNGKAAIKQDFVEFFENIPDTYTKIENLFQDGEWAIIEWTGGGTFQGKTPFTFEGCGFFKVLNGKIVSQKGYWDMHSWLKKLDLK